MATETTQALKNRITEDEARRERERKRAKARAAAAAAKRKAAKKKKPKEKISTGRDDSQSNYERLSAGVRARLDAARAANNQEAVIDLEARLEALKETVQ